MDKFKSFSLSSREQRIITGGGACQNLDNCQASRHGACIYSSDYGQCMYNQAQVCDGLFLLDCMIEMEE